ncbi:MAG: hypothetical protein ACYS5V_16925 [Planctomycetota bacterium]|jgi:hypothetical protein
MIEEEIIESITIMQLQNKQRRELTSFDDINSSCENLIISLKDCVKNWDDEIALEELEKEFYKPDIAKKRLHKMEIELIELSRKYE